MYGSRYNLLTLRCGKIDNGIYLSPSFWQIIQATGRSEELNMYSLKIKGVRNLTKNSQQSKIPAGTEKHDEATIARTNPHGQRSDKESGTKT